MILQAQTKETKTAACDVRAEKINAYRRFLQSKVATSPVSGFEVAADAIHPSLKPHQRDLVQWAVRGGRRAIFAAFGLGKTRMQIEIMRLVIEHEGGKALIICPLGVKQEFVREDGPAVGIDDITYVTSDADIAACKSPYMITNYERVRDGNIDVNQFTVVTLDEASVLRSFGSKTYQTFLEMFKDVPYRYVATATPSPNKFKELIHYAGFLGVMDTGQALTRFFQRDSTKANNLTLYPHKEAEFWHWMASWAVFIEYPSDLGYSDDGYILPALNVHWHVVPVDHKQAWSDMDGWGQYKLFAESASGLPAASKEKRRTMPQRMDKAEEIMAEDPDAHWIIWHHLEDERKEIERRVKSVKTIFGSQSIEKKEELILDFAHGKYPIMATKPNIAGSGCNFQRYCHNNIFVGIDYKFNDFIQAVHRTYRFQQDKEVNVHIIYAESEEEIANTLKDKWAQHVELVGKMRDIVKEFGLSGNTNMLKRSMGVDRHQTEGEFFKAINNDCIEEVIHWDDDSLDMILTSIPFSNQYEYTPTFEDFGHNDDDDRFFEQMDHLVPELLRVLRPGRVAAIHVKDRIHFGNVTGLGMPSLNPFSDMTVASFRKHGFIFFGRITIDTDVVRENNQTYRLGWTEMCKDGTKMGVGVPEYILLFRKLPSDTSNAYADDPVVKDKSEYTRAQWQIDAAGLWRSNGDRLLSPADMVHMPMDAIKRWWKSYNSQHVYDYEMHVEMGKDLENAGKLPAQFMLFPPQSTKDNDIWTDINRMLTLNTEQSRRNNEMHVCPLQLDVIERLIRRFTNEGEVVFDPFGGVGSTAYQAVKMKRYGLFTELNPAYYTDGVKYCEEAEAACKVPTLFDLMEVA